MELNKANEIRILLNDYDNLEEIKNNFNANIESVYDILLDNINMDRLTCDSIFGKINEGIVGIIDEYLDDIKNKISKI